MKYIDAERTTVIDENDEPRPPCPHCDGRLEEREDSVVDGEFCPTCGCAPDGSLAVTTDVPHYHRPYEPCGPDESREQYRVSRAVIMYGAHPAVGGSDSYGLDDGSASYSNFISA